MDWAVVAADAAACLVGPAFNACVLASAIIVACADVAVVVTCGGVAVVVCSAVASVAASIALFGTLVPCAPAEAEAALLDEACIVEALVMSVGGLADPCGGATPAAGARPLIVAPSVAEAA